MSKGKTKVGKMMFLFAIIFISLPFVIAAAPFILLQFLQTVVDWGAFGGLLITLPVWIGGFFLIRFIVRKAKGGYDNITGKEDWRTNLTEQDIRARKRAEEYFRQK